MTGVRGIVAVVIAVIAYGGGYALYRRAHFVDYEADGVRAADIELRTARQRLVFAVFFPALRVELAVSGRRLRCDRDGRGLVEE